MRGAMIKDNVRKILENIPKDVRLVAAAKTRNAQEVLEAIDAGIKIVGENYVQEAESVYEQVGRKAEWHFIGHLQKNKVKKAVKIFDMIHTVDSRGLAGEIDKRCRQSGKVVSVLIEVNSGREEQKSGVKPEDVPSLVSDVSKLSGIRVMGLMTMGPLFGDPGKSRPYFVETRKVFEKIGLAGMPGVEMKYLSMGMSNSYRVAIEEGANMIRLGTLIFGERE